MKDLVVGYAKQETVDPLKTLGRYLGWGIVGSVLLAIGLIFGLLALLRGLQEFDVFNNVTQVDGGRWSWVPYFVTAVVGAAVIAIFGVALNRALKQRERS